MLLDFQYILVVLRPWGYHLSSVVLHAAVCLAVYRLTDRLLARCSVDDDSRHVATALTVGAFAVHPLRVEVVAWTSLSTLSALRLVRRSLGPRLPPCESAGRT